MSGTFPTLRPLELPEFDDARFKAGFDMGLLLAALSPRTLRTYDGDIDPSCAQTAARIGRACGYAMTVTKVHIGNLDEEDWVRVRFTLETSPRAASTARKTRRRR
jgi:hypothetical protein